MDKKKLYALIAVLVVVCGGMAWYFMYYTKTPTYSLYLVQDAVQKHDVQTFKQHVDLDRVMSRLVDDYMGYQLQNAPEIKDNPFKGLAEGFVNVAKPAMVSALKDKVIRMVEGDISDNQQPTPTTGNNTTNPNPVENLNVSTIDYKGIAYEKKDGKIAIVGIKAVNPQLVDEFIFDLKMSELNDGKWQVVEVSNANDYLIKLEKAEKVALKKYVDAIQPSKDENARKYYEWKEKYPQWTVDAVKERKIMFTEFFDSMEKVDVPIGAEKLSKLWKERRKMWEKCLDIRQRYFEGDHSQQINEEFQKIDAEMKENKDKIDKIENSVRDLQVP